jgi:dihydrofolate reductase
MSRKVRLFIATSLDGFITGPGESLDWLFSDDDYGYDAFIAEVDTLAMGRRTYEVVKSLGVWPYDGLATWVFTRQEHMPHDGNVTFTATAPAEWLREVERAPGKDIWVVGGGQLIRDFLDARLVDEMTIAVHPVVLGGGTPLFPSGSARHKLRLANVRSYASGLVSSTYVVQT